MSDIRPLPARPSLAYERKQAKALLRRLRAGAPDALARARDRHPGIDPSHPEAARLARHYERRARWLIDTPRTRSPGPSG